MSINSNNNIFMIITYKTTCWMYLHHYFYFRVHVANNQTRCDDIRSGSNGDDYYRVWPKSRTIVTRGIGPHLGLYVMLQKLTSFSYMINHYQLIMQAFFTNHQQSKIQTFFRKLLLIENSDVSWQIITIWEFIRSP